MLGVIAIGTFVVSAEDLKPGDKAPEFSLAGSDGSTHSLSEYRGTTVVLAWFPKAFTGGWTAECKSFRENGDAIKKFNAAYFMVSVDDIETNTKFAESLEADFPLLSNEEKDVAEAYGVVSTVRPLPARWTFYIDGDGKIIYIDKDVNASTAGSDVAVRLAALGVAER